MATQTRKKWYFVSHLEKRDRPPSGMRYEIQVLNADGQAVVCAHVDDLTSTVLEIQGHPIPAPVIEAARKQQLGKGEYVDEAGSPMPPF
jgi:hypothetical protein